MIGEPEQPSQISADLPILANSIACVVLSDRYINESMDGEPLGTSNMFYSAVFVRCGQQSHLCTLSLMVWPCRGLAVFTGLAALAYMLWIWVDSRHRMVEKRKRKLSHFNYQRIQANRMFNRLDTPPAKSDEDERRGWLKQAQKARKFLLFFVAVFLIMWTVPSTM